MKIERVTLDFVEIPLKSPFETSFGVSTVKSCWMLTVEAEGLSGYAESVADVEPGYSPETHATVYYTLKNHVWPRLRAADLQSPEQALSAMTAVRGHRMAKAAIEMAVWDWFARARGVPLYRLLGGDGTRRDIPVGVSIGIQPHDQALTALADDYLRQGYRRLKVKIKPGRDLAPLTALRRAVGDTVPIMADANSAYRLRDANHLALLDDLNLMMLEQPLAEDDMVDHAELAKRLRTPICLDEAIESDEDARKAIAIGAAAIINLKVGRVGGLAMARRIHDLAVNQAIPLWCGGMLETGIGRAHNLHLTTLPGFTLPGDTSASDRYFAHDLIDPPFRLSPHGTLPVPQGPGIGVEPDPGRLARFRRYQEIWRRDEPGVRGGVPYDGSGARF
ncbi:MAG: o-succinylbenzoate synthase [Thermaerobacter sp.]|nr:o-succinylbenzoate synthase [Thermaerobacter sp.]